VIIELVTALMDHAAAAPPSVGEVDPAGWQERFDDVFAQVVAPAFRRGERGCGLSRICWARKACLNHWGYRCAVCNFSFEERYGPLGQRLHQRSPHTGAVPGAARIPGRPGQRPAPGMLQLPRHDPPRSGPGASRRRAPAAAPSVNVTLGGSRRRRITVNHAPNWRGRPSSSGPGGAWPPATKLPWWSR
jgi:hypothetical protein